MHKVYVLDAYVRVMSDTRAVLDSV